MAIVRGRILDVVNHREFNGELVYDNGIVTALREVDTQVPPQYILPGFVDSHIHIESSMLVPSEFARLAVRHGTVATVSDPHEIANVCGREGVEFMIANGSQVPLKFHFGAPSCVPATLFETSGARLDLHDVKELLGRDEIFYLAEMMNWPGVLNDDEEVLSKIRAALTAGKPVDGHAPGLKGLKAAKYASAGISTDHECFTREEAIDKIAHGMKIIIREGSAARNFDALISLLEDYPGKVMFCSDDKHPDDLLKGHINELASRSLALGYDLFDTLYACSAAPVRHYKLTAGLLQPGDAADFIIVDDLKRMHVTQTWIDGHLVFDRGEVNFPRVNISPINNFTTYLLNKDDFIKESDQTTHPVIVAQDGELITGRSDRVLKVTGGQVQPDVANDILKIAVVNRYIKVKPAVGFISNFGIREGAIASSVAHDSHNIIVVGTTDAYLAEAVNLIMENKGGISAVDRSHKEVLALPIAGIMSESSGEEVAAAYERLTTLARQMGCGLKSPFMLISFMALLVIPSLKISDKGLFDADKFEFV